MLSYTYFALHFLGLQARYSFPVSFTNPDHGVSRLVDRDRDFLERRNSMETRNGNGRAIDRRTIDEWFPIYRDSLGKPECTTFLDEALSL